MEPTLRARSATSEFSLLFVVLAGRWRKLSNLNNIYNIHSSCVSPLVGCSCWSWLLVGSEKIKRLKPISELPGSLRVGGQFLALCPAGVLPYVK